MLPLPTGVVFLAAWTLPRRTWARAISDLSKESFEHSPQRISWCLLPCPATKPAEELGGGGCVEASGAETGVARMESGLETAIKIEARDWRLVVSQTLTPTAGGLRTACRLRLGPEADLNLYAHTVTNVCTSCLRLETPPSRQAARGRRWVRPTAASSSGLVDVCHASVVRPACQQGRPVCGSHRLLCM